MNSVFYKILLAVTLVFTWHSTASLAVENNEKAISPTIQADEQHFQHHYLKVSGQRIHYVTVGEGEPVLLIPGWPQTWYTWRYVMTELANNGYMAIAVDPPGTGYSDRPISGYDTGTVAATLHKMMI